MTFTLATCEYDTHGPDSPFYRGTCRACALRAMAAGPLYHSSSREGVLTSAYRQALTVTFPGEDPIAVHAEVKAVAQRMNNQRAEML